MVKKYQNTEKTAGSFQNFPKTGPGSFLELPKNGEGRIPTSSLHGLTRKEMFFCGNPYKALEILRPGPFLGFTPTGFWKFLDPSLNRFFLSFSFSFCSCFRFVFHFYVFLFFSFYSYYFNFM